MGLSLYGLEPVANLPLLASWWVQYLRRLAGLVMTPLGAVGIKKPKRGFGFCLMLCALLQGADALAGQGIGVSRAAEGAQAFHQFVQRSL